MMISINGELIPEKDAKISVLDHGLLLGDGVFETMRTVDGRLFRFEQHYARLCQSALQISLSLPCNQEQMLQWVEKAILANGYSESKIRITITRGKGKIGLNTDCEKPQVIILVEEFIPGNYSDGVSVMTIEMERNLPSVKSLSYLPSVICKLEATKKGVFEALLYNREGYITEGSFSNVFFLKNHTLITPEASVLPGLTRDAVIELAKQEDISIKIVPVKKEKLVDMEEVFLTFTTGGVVPVIRIDAIQLKIGPVTRKLEQLYRDKFFKTKLC
jgi:branched-chain amino acid aminotransferase